MIALQKLRASRYLPMVKPQDGTMQLQQHQPHQQVSVTH
jgi:hypothetical protein